MESALLLGIKPIYFVTLQVVGGAIGNMICINNIVAVCATVGIDNKEGEIIKINILPAVVYGLICACFIWILIKI